MTNFIVFLGAGSSVPFGIPTMTELVKGFEQKIKSSYSQTLNLFNDIKNKLKNYKYFDIEALIAVLQDIIDIDKVPGSVFGKPSVHYFSSWGISFDKMVEYNKETALRNHNNAKNLLIDVKNYIADVCCIKDQQPYDLYDEFFNQIFNKNLGINYLDLLKRKGQKNIPCHLFTTNYDKVIEAYCHRKEINYDCGERQNGVVDIKIDSRVISKESKFHIFKLHGSTYWYVDEENHMRWLTQHAQVGNTTHLGDRVDKELAIYPAQEKYTFREPFYNMFHYLKERLNDCNIVYVIGYSFRDDDILGLFTDAMDLNERLSLLLIDPNAEDIIRDKFPNYAERIEAISSKFSIQSIRNLA
jgi:NAD-dependent SIR2 family protein deacetylase